MAKLSMRVVMISTSVLFTAVVLKLCVPIVMEFAFSEAVLAWLRPPYLYVVINGIIITIVASSKLQSSKVVVAGDLPPEAVVAYPAPIKVSADYAAVYDGIVDEKSGQEVEVKPEFAYGYDEVVVKGEDFDVDHGRVEDGMVAEMESADHGRVEVQPEFAYGYDEVVVKGEDFDVDHGRVEDGMVAEMESADHGRVEVQPEFAYGYDEVVVKGEDFDVDHGRVEDGMVAEMESADHGRVEVQPEFAYGYDEVVVKGEDFDVDHGRVEDGMVAEMESADHGRVEVQPEFAYGYDEVVVKGEDFDVDHGRVEDGVVAEVESAETTALALNATEEDVIVGGEDEVAVLTSLSPQQNSTTTEYLVASYERPPVSGRIGQRKGVKSSPEGVRTLGVSKPKRHETLENTWKTITEGRPIPLARHLKKSDTWETHNRVGHLQEVLHHDQTMLKSETFNDRSITPVANRPPVKLRRDPSGSGKLKREPSPSQDELNRRVEAFINKFNEEMRLQRQESLNQYMEMINRGAH